MRQRQKEFRETVFRTKGTVGLVLLGSFMGFVAWVYRAVGAEIDLLTLIKVARLSLGNAYFFVVIALSAALGGWLAWLIFWRRPAAPDDANGDGGAGWRAPRF